MVQLDGDIEGTTATGNAVINNNTKRNLIIDGVRVENIATGGKQALYNKGTVEIKGNSYFSAESSTEPNIRATVQNVSGGTLTVKEGTIISNNYSALENAGTLTIGIKDSTYNENNPLIQGKINGIKSTTNLKFYDGVIKGQTASFSDRSKIVDREVGYGLKYTNETIDGNNYEVAYLIEAKTVTFDARGGISSEASRGVVEGNAVGVLPTCKKMGYTFNGWFTHPTSGEQINQNTIIDDNITFYAHWTSNEAAEINGVIYVSVQEAVTSAPANTQTTINLLKDSSEYIVVPSNKNIVLNLNNHSLTNFDETHTVLANTGTIEISNGSFSSNAANATIDNNPGGTMYLRDVNVIATGERQAVYNRTGYLEISGNSTFSATPTGVPTTATLGRATIQNVSNGTVVIKSGTITGIIQQAISSEGTLILGEKDDGTLSNTSPLIIGNTYGVVCLGTFNFYDGIIKGVTNSINGTITEMQSGTQIKNDTETIGEKTYITSELEAIP